MFTSPEVTKMLAEERRRARQGEARRRRLARLARDGRQSAAARSAAPVTEASGRQVVVADRAEAPPPDRRGSHRPHLDAACAA